MGWKNAGYAVCVLAVLSACGCGPSAAPGREGSVYFYLGDYFNNDGISFDADRKDGDFDTPENPSGSTYPAEELPPGNAVVPVLACPGLLVMCPPKKDGAVNNIACKGQVLRGFTPQRFLRIYFIGAAVKGDKKGEFVFHYRDGTVERKTLLFKDWCTREPGLDHVVVFRCTHRHNYKGEDEDIPAAMYAVCAPLLKDKQLDSIQLPRNEDIHIFAVTAMVPLR